MIFSYSGASLQNSLSPGTKRHTKDGVQPLHVKHSLAWETHSRVAGVLGGRSKFPVGMSFIRLSHPPLCTPVQVSPPMTPQPPSPRTPLGDAPWRRKLKVARGRATEMGRRWVQSVLKIKSGGQFAIWVAFVPFPLKL